MAKLFATVMTFVFSITFGLFGVVQATEDHGKAGEDHGKAGDDHGKSADKAHKKGHAKKKKTS